MFLLFCHLVYLLESWRRFTFNVIQLFEILADSLKFVKC
jgi:hypothetical protein